MDTAQARTSLRNLNAEFFSLTPSSLITLYEISVSDLYMDEVGNTKIQPFYFHNSLKLTQNKIIFNGIDYIAAPIFADNFEFNSKGAIATPKLSLTVQDANSPELTRLKGALRQLGDLRGARLIRRKTFAKFLDDGNWPTGEKPAGFVADPNAQLASDIYYFSRKSADNKNYIEYEMSSVLDLDSLRLPQRTVVALRCQWQYRGAGCNFEYNDPNNSALQRRNSDIHGDATLLVNAPAVATDKDELIVGDILGSEQTITDKGAYQPNFTYMIGHQTYITKNGLKYYFVAKENNVLNIQPPNDTYWVADQCSKSLYACRLRFNPLGITTLPYGGYPSVSKINE